MAEEYVLVKKTIHDQMKLRQNERKDMQDQGTNTETSDELQTSVESVPPPKPEEPHTGSGLIYDKPLKKKSPPGMRTSPPKKKKTWIKF